MAVNFRRFFWQRAAGLVGLVVAAALLGGCGPAPPAFNSTDITGSTFGRDFALHDAQGRRRTLADFRGKAVLMFFGYTQCPDVCPTAMARFAQVMKALGAEAARTQVIFVTVDPERDTPDVLARYVPYFHPDFIGLTGTLAETDVVAKEFRVYYSKRPAAEGPGYSVDHWAGAYAFDAGGRLRLYVSPDAAAEAIAADVRRLLAG